MASETASKLTLSIVIPARNEANRLPRCLLSIAASAATWKIMHEVIVVVPRGDSEGTAAVAAELATAVLQPSVCAGRGEAIRLGVEASSARLLLVLHADTMLHVGALPAIVQHLDAHGGVCTLRPWFVAPRIMASGARWPILADEMARRERGPFACLAVSYWSFLERWCASSMPPAVLSCFGDAGCGMSRALWEEIGGAPPWPLFDDVELFRRARAAGAPLRKLEASIYVDSRRFVAVGVVLYPLLCLLLILLYLLGAPPEKLARMYAWASSGSARCASCTSCVEEEGGKWHSATRRAPPGGARVFVGPDDARDDAAGAPGPLLCLRAPAPVCRPVLITCFFSIRETPDI